MSFSYNNRIYVGDKSATGATPTITFSAQEVNNAIALMIPTNCKASKIYLKFKGAKSMSLLTGKGNITVSLGGFSQTFSEVIGNDGTNTDFGSNDKECTTGDIKGYFTSNCRVSNDLNFSFSKGASSTWWRVECEMYIDYETPDNSITINAGAGTYIDINDWQYSIWGTGIASAYEEDKETITFSGLYSGATYKLRNVQADIKRGCEWSHWESNHPSYNGNTNPTITVVVDRQMYITAVNTIYTYYVAYYPNGGTGTMPVDTVKYFDTYIMRQCEFTAPTIKLTYSLDGGSCEKTEETKSRDFMHWLFYHAGEEFEGYTCNYNAGYESWNLATDNGATSTATAQWSESVKFTLPSTPTKDGYKFLGWSDGTKTYKAGATYTATGNTTISALWEKVKIEDVYGANTKATVYVANTEVKEIYVGNEKVYG